MAAVLFSKPKSLNAPSFDMPTRLDTRPIERMQEQAFYLNTIESLIQENLELRQQLADKHSNRP